MAKAKTVFHHEYPVSRDYDGLLRALDESYKRQGRHELHLVNAIPLDSVGAVFRLLLGRGTLESLSPALDEGWIVQPTQGSPRAEVSQVLPDDDALIVRCSAPKAGNRFAPVVQLTAPDFLLQLRNWLRLRQGQPLPKMLDILSDAPEQTFLTGEHGLPSTLTASLRRGQLEAIEALGPSILNLWGPPGTGKTLTVAHAVFSLVSRGYKVALLAPTNIAVDTAVLALPATFAQAGQPLKGGYVVRAGYPKLEERLAAHPELLAWQQSLDHHQQSLHHLRTRLREVERAMARAKGPSTDKLNRERAELKAHLRDGHSVRSKELWELARNAQVLATTVYSALHNEAMLHFFSTEKVAIVIDEAAMVPRYSTLPLLELLGGADAPQGQLTRVPTQVSILLAGDPRQLAPIFSQSNEKDVNGRYWLGESLMEELLERPSNETLPGNPHLLTEQFRMDRSISDRISQTYYGGLLTTVDVPSRPTPPLVDSWPHDGLVVVDPRQARLADDAPPINRLRFDMKKDERSLQVAVRLIRQALKGRAKSVLWLTPFRDQARLARKLVDAHFSHANVRAGTVHTSQGGEADLVIFDPVHLPHRWLAGLMTYEIDIERLVNVAVSRGRGQVIVFASQADLAKNNIFRRLLHDATRWDGGSDKVS